MAQGFGRTITPWSILGAGLLTGKFNKKDFAFGGRQAEFERLAERRNQKRYGLRELAIADAVAEVAKTNGENSAQVALNWVRQKGTIPIIGVSKITQIEDSLAALGWALTENEIQVLDEVSDIELGFPP